MDILRKMFGKPKDEKDPAAVLVPDTKDEFRKPIWFEESETDDELFDGDHQKFIFQIFTNPIEMQKHFDRQMNQFLKSMKEFEDNSELFEEFSKENYLKPGFEKGFQDLVEKKITPDTDLDGEIYADQLHSLLQRITPEVQKILPKTETNLNSMQAKKKLTDEEKIMGKIHGTIAEDNGGAVVKRKEIVPKMPPHFGGVFEGTYQGPKMFGQSVIKQTVRKPDGSYETKQIVTDSSGNVKTTVTRTINGKTETITTYGNGDEKPTLASKPEKYSSGGNLYVTKAGYALPKNLW